LLWQKVHPKLTRTLRRPLVFPIFGPSLLSTKRLIHAIRHSSLWICRTISVPKEDLWIERAAISPALQEVAARLPCFIDKARSAGNLIVFVRCSYSSENNRYLSDVFLEQAARQRAGAGTRYPMCEDGTWQADFYGDVRPKHGDITILKHRYSAFHNTDLDLVLRSHGIRTVVLTGVLTNVCVETTAREAFVRDYYVVLVENGTALCHPEDHAMTLKNIERFFGVVSSTTALETLWGRTASELSAAE
jgi:ureidoacrylate peracid hydrolase